MMETEINNMPMEVKEVAAPTPVVEKPTVARDPIAEKKKSNLFGILFFLFLLILPICLCSGFLIFASQGGDNSSVLNSGYSTISGDSSSKNKLLSIKIDAPILSESAGESFLFSTGYVYGYTIKEELMQAADDADIKGVILEINSPGGTVVGSKAISDGVAYYREKTGKPVYAYIQDMAASGGYWAAAATDKIIADTGSLTGSIGVLFGPFEYYDKLVSVGSVTAQNGIDIYYITGGQYKDLGNPLRRITEEELKTLQRDVNHEYDVFVSHVATKRKIDPLVVKQDIKALLYGTKTAMEYKLIDMEGSRETAYTELATAVNAKDDYQIVRKQTDSSLFSALLGVKSPEKTKTSCAFCNKLLFLHGNPVEYQLVQ
jgi:protease-4